MDHSLLVTRTDSTVTATLTDEVFLGPGEVLVDVSHSSLNYKDGMALRGDRGVMRVDPLVPGIDAVGTVVSSEDPRFAPGDLVTTNGGGLGEFRHGGYSTRQRVPAEATVHVPDVFDAWQAAAIGTAGFTAALSVAALREQGVDGGEVLVTGATGGVGSIAVHLLATLGHDVVAATGRAGEHGDWLRELGAGELVDRAELAAPGRPLQKARWAGVVDCIGSHTLVNACAQTQWGGTVTACGLAQGPDLPATVLPFILRGVKLVGINSVDAPRELRERAWALLADTLDVDVLTSLSTTVPLAEVVAAGEELMDGRRRGRTVVAVQP
ncbi:putative zinc-binding dehydrogenase [Corynebacterium humireducens NBRC 106098 = DSM 45392]|uniref:Putative zinc-binding dehydrogenase n=1 Tax=Corynebacterium humireducens NBRC 106098 = DSM 45392 TaxID=1223515 RepID=A0A0B5DBP2_9CORY|nr:MDR family oxidoreductase [Corynebacterium humireducens]AJE34362.1 putative zinc-binding dehydrogenase [Corynebacterium humireducens NBRC 106098 = DSM 45392]